MDRASTAVEQWRKEMPGLDLLAMEIIGRLSEASLILRRDWLEPLFAEFGVQAGEFDVLATLRRAGVPYALTPTTLFESAMISSGGMTNRLDRLENSGWIKRSPNPNDRRGTLVSLTDEGVALLNKMVPAHLANEQDAINSMSPEEQAQLNQLLMKMVKSVSRRGKAC